MSKTERALMVTRNERGTIERLTFNPRKCPPEQLEAIVRQKLFSAEGVACLFRVDDKLYVLQQEYFRDVRELEPELREEHIWQTVERLSTASRLIIIPVNLKH